MKRAREATDESDTLYGDMRTASGTLDQPAAPTTTTPDDDDDDPYGFGNIGAPGFVSKPSGGMQSGYVPGYLRVPGSAGGGIVPAVGAAKLARTAMLGPGSKPTSAFRRGPIKSQPPAETALGATASASPLPVLEPKQPSSLQPPVSSALAVPEEPESALALQRRRVQNKDLPEQHRLPEDLPLVAPGKIAKTSASASGPLSAQIKALPKFHEEIQMFVEQSVPNQAEQLTKVIAAFQRPSNRKACFSFCHYLPAYVCLSCSLWSQCCNVRVCACQDFQVS